MKCQYNKYINCELFSVTAEDCDGCGENKIQMEIDKELSTPYENWFFKNKPFIDETLNIAGRPTPTNDSEAACEMLSIISGREVFVGTLEGQARNYLTQKIAEVTEEILADKKYERITNFPAKAFNNVVDGKCRDRQGVLDMLVRLGRTMSHKQDALRTQISYQKELLHNTPSTE